MVETEDDADVVRRARASASDAALGEGWSDLADTAALVASELVTNAVLHGGGCTAFDVSSNPAGLRIEVRDRSRIPPVVGRPSDGSLTGRGMQLVTSLSARWGTDLLPGGSGKVVWVELVPGSVAGPVGAVETLSADDLLAMWDDDLGDEPTLVEQERRIRVELGDVPTDLLMAAKSHVDNVVRELRFAASGDGPDPQLPSLLEAVARFAEARLSIKHQALEALNTGAERTRLVLDLTPAAADDAEQYLAALDEIDAYCRAQRMLTLESPPQHRAFRRWYVEELTAQLRARAAGDEPRPPQTLERRLLQELDRVADANRAAQRAARLYAVASALATAATPEEVSAAVLDEGVAALGASGGGILLATDDDTLALPGSVGYDDEVVARLRSESKDAELPAAVALRTGESVWLESRDERDERFPELVGLEAGTVALCAVPLVVQDRRLGAIRFSFTEPRLFDEDERRFVHALAALSAQALDRAQLQRSLRDR